jgi:TRAP-type C4-dicarboxylate transport system permease small subunit
MLRARLEACSERLNRAAEILLAALIAVTVAAATAQVVFRYGVQASLTWSEELARYAFIWAIFIGTSVAARRGQHIAVDSLVKTLPRVVQRWLRLANLLLCGAFFCLFAYVSALLVLNAIPQKSSSLEISIAWVYAAAVIGAALTVLHLVNAALRPELRESS